MRVILPTSSFSNEVIIPFKKDRAGQVASVSDIRYGNKLAGEELYNENTEEGNKKKLLVRDG